MATQPRDRIVAAFSSTGLAFDDSVKPDLVAPGVGITSASPGDDVQHVQRDVGRGGAGRGRCGARAAGAPRLEPARVRGALVGTARAVRDEEGDAAEPVEAQGGGA